MIYGLGDFRRADGRHRNRRVETKLHVATSGSAVERPLFSLERLFDPLDHLRRRIHGLLEHRVHFLAR